MLISAVISDRDHCCALYVAPKEEDPIWILKTGGQANFGAQTRTRVQNTIDSCQFMDDIFRTMHRPMQNMLAAAGLSVETNIYIKRNFGQRPAYPKASHE